MSTIRLSITAIRGTTTYHWEIESQAENEAEASAAMFEKFLEGQSDRLALNDTQSRSTQ